MLANIYSNTTKSLIETALSSGRMHRSYRIDVKFDLILKGYKFFYISPKSKRVVYHDRYVMDYWIYSPRSTDNFTKAILYKYLTVTKICKSLSLSLYHITSDEGMH